MSLSYYTAFFYHLPTIYPKKVLTSDFTLIYNGNINKVTIYLFFITMSAAESKNVYQRCFIALFVLFLIEVMVQFACLVGLNYLPAAQAALALKVALIFSIIIDMACVMLSLVAAVYVSSLGTVLCVLFSVLVIVLIVAACVVFILALGKGGGGGGGSSRGSSSGGSCCFCWLGGGGGTGSSSGRSTGSSDDCCSCQEPGPATLAFVVTFAGFVSCGVAAYCLIWHCQWTMVHEHEHDNTPFLITLLLCSAFRTLLAGLMIFFKPLAAACWSGPNDEEERRKILEDASLDTCRMEERKDVLGDASLKTFYPPPTGKTPPDVPIDE
jgi:lysylphosphatidylglycerol synthetase-like protein (DUF2156 family)